MLRDRTISSSRVGAAARVNSTAALCITAYASCRSQSGNGASHQLLKHTSDGRHTFSSSIVSHRGRDTLSEKFLSTISVLFVSFLRVRSTFAFENTCPERKQFGEARTPPQNLSLLHSKLSPPQKNGAVPTSLSESLQIGHTLTIH